MAHVVHKQPDEFTTPPPGTYGIVVDSCDLIGEEDDRPRVQMAMRVVNDPSGKYADATVMDWLPLTGKPGATRRLGLALRAFGFKVDPNSEVSFDTDDLIGKTCTVELELDEYQGKTRVRVAYAGYSQEPPAGPGSGAAKGDSVGGKKAPADGPTPF